MRLPPVPIRPSSCFDELWAYSSERARRLFDEMVPPPTRKIACRLTVTYAGFEGESELLEELYKRGKKQPEVGPSLHAGDGLLMAWHHSRWRPGKRKTGSTRCAVHGGPINTYAWPKTDG